MLTLESEAMQVQVLPEYGSRVCALVDRRSSRDWLAKGGQSEIAGEDAAFLAAQAVGWDECFPTVSPWDAEGTPWRRRLRDHGDLWGRPWLVRDVDTHRISTQIETGEYLFRRILTLDGPQLRCAYHLASRGRESLPYMWAQHALLAVTPADRLVLPGVDSVEATHVAFDGRERIPRAMRWPGPSAHVPLALDAVHPPEAHFAAKLYAVARTAPVASIGTAEGWLDIAWDRAALPYAGIWLNYGGWPSPGLTHHIAIEATTAPVDHLGQAVSSGTARHLAPGGAASWWVTFTLRHT